MAKQRETAWAVLDSNDQMWRGRGKMGFANAGMLFKTAGILKAQLDIARDWLPEGCRAVRVRITDGIEEEHNIDEFLDNWQDLDTP